MSQRTWLVIGLLTVTAVVIALAVLPNTTKNSTKTRVGIFQIVDHPALDAVRSGLQDHILESEHAQDIEFVYENANGDASQIETIANKFATDKCQIVCTIGTPCAQMMMSKCPTQVVVFGGATDPVQAGLVESYERPGGVMTGTVARPNVALQLEMARQLVGGERLGVIFNPSEDNSVVVVNDLENECKHHGYKLVKRPIPSSRELYASIVSLKDEIDLLYLPTDNMVQAALPAVFRGANDIGVPCINCDVNSVKQGALFSVGADYYDVGVETGKMILEIVDGTDPSMMSVRSAKNDIFINIAVAKQFGISVPPKMLNSAKVIVGQ